MALPLLAVMGAGAGLAGLGSIIGGRSRKKAAAKAADEQRRRTAYIDKMAQGQMQLGPSQWETEMQGRMQQIRDRQPQTWTPEGVTADTITVDDANYDPWTAEGYDASVLGEDFLSGLTDNAGQDSLLQMMQKGGGFNPASFSSDPNMMSALRELSSTGNPFDTSAAFAALQPLEKRASDEQAAALRASTGSIGSRFGTALAGAEAEMRSRLTEDANARRAMMSRDAFEAAQGRRLSATGQLNQKDALLAQVAIANMQGGLEGARNTISAAEARRAANALGLQGRLANMDATNSARAFTAGARNVAGSENAARTLAARQGNQGARLTAGQANAANRLTAAGMRNQFGLAGAQFNRDSQSQLDDMLMRYILGGSGIESDRRGGNRQLLGIMAGQGVPGANPYAGAEGDALGGFGSLIGMMGMLGQPAAPATRARAGNVTAVNPNMATPGRMNPWDQVFGGGGPAYGNQPTVYGPEAGVTTSGIPEWMRS